MIYIKKIDGRTVIKNRNQIVVLKNGMQTINPPHEMLIDDGWKEYIPPTPAEPTEEELLERAKRRKVSEIHEYGESDAVDEFSVNGIDMWLDKATRAGLMLRFQAEQAAGAYSTTLWHNGIQFPLPLGSAIQMLYALEIYASKCYDNTQRHMSEVQKLNTIEEVESYDYTTGYPEKLTF